MADGSDLDSGDPLDAVEPIASIMKRAAKGESVPGEEVQRLVLFLQQNNIHRRPEEEIELLRAKGQYRVALTMDNTTLQANIEAGKVIETAKYALHEKEVQAGDAANFRFAVLMGGVLFVVFAVALGGAWLFLHYGKVEEFGKICQEVVKYVVTFAGGVGSTLATQSYLGKKRAEKKAKEELDESVD